MVIFSGPIHVCWFACKISKKLTLNCLRENFHKLRVKFARLHKFLVAQHQSLLPDPTRIGYWLVNCKFLQVGKSIQSKKESESVTGQVYLRNPTILLTGFQCNGYIHFYWIRQYYEFHMICALWYLHWQ